MVDASLKRHFEKAGVGMIALDAGARALVEELSSDDGAVEVVLREGDFLPEGNARMTVDLDPAAYAFLADHRITEDAVLPVVMVQEWFARAVRTQVPDAGSLSVEDLGVLKGVVLSGFPARRYRFDIEIEAVAGDRRTFALKLKDADGQPRYAARVVAHRRRRRPGRGFRGRPRTTGRSLRPRSMATTGCSTARPSRPSTASAR